MDQHPILNEIQRRDDILSLPQAISELLTEMEKPDFSADTLANIVLKDPALTGRILKMANSSFYHRFAEVRTVHQAVVVLGLTTVKCLALSSSVLNPDQLSNQTGVDTKAFFTSILMTAAASEKLAKSMGYQAPEEAFIGGLLHDVGIIYLLHSYPEEYKKIINHELRSRYLCDAEKEVFGIDHTEIGYHLAMKWKLPENIAEAIRSHHTMTGHENDAGFSGAIRLATLLVDDTTFSYHTELEERLKLISHMVESMGVDKDIVDEITSSLLADAINVADYIGLDIGKVDDLLMRANKEIWRTYLMIENLFKERQELSSRLLQEERSKGAVESKNIAMATLSHYVNNATMAILGRIQLIQMLVTKDQTDRLRDKLPETLEVMERSVMKIVAVLAEIKEISPIDEVEFHSMSQALRVDDRIEKRMKQLSTESGLALSDEAKQLVK